MRPITPALVERLRRTDRTARPIAIAEAVSLNANGTLRQHIRQRKDQWQQADSTTGFSLLDNGDVRLMDTIVTTVTKAGPPDAYFEDLNRATPFDILLVSWGGTQDADFELQRLKLHLDPRRGASTQEVVQWKVELMRPAQIVIDQDEGFATLLWVKEMPLCDAVTVAAVGEAEGLVTFDFTTVPERPKPMSVGAEVIFLTNQISQVPAPWNVPTTLAYVYALKADGSTAAPSGSVGFGYDSATSSVTTNGVTIRSRHVSQQAPPFETVSGEGWRFDEGSPNGTPVCTIETGTYSNATLTFNTNKFDLGGTPTNDVVFTITGHVPTGTALTGQVLKDSGNPATDADWRTFLSGQKSTDLADVSKRQTYELRAKLETNGAGNLTPTLTRLGVTELVETDLGDVAMVSGGNWGIDPITLKGEIPDVTVTAIHDGLRDYADAISDLLANNAIGNMRLRLYWGARDLSRDRWLHVDDLIIDGSFPKAASHELRCLTNLALLKDLVPRYEPGEVVAPNADASVGAWTTDAGGTTNLYQRINEASFNDTDYVRSEVNPSNSAYELHLGTPVDPVGRKLFVEYRYQKDSTDTIDLTVEFRQGTTVIVSSPHTNIPAEPTAGSFSLSQSQIDQITDYTDIRIRFIANKTAGAGSTRARVSWARFRAGGKREGAKYTNTSLKDVYDDLLNNRLGINASLIGPGVEDDATLVSKTISTVGETKPTGKRELDAIAHLAGGGITSSQGRIKFFDLYGNRSIRAVFPSTEIKIEAVGPGYEQRVPAYFVKYRYNETTQEYEDEIRVLSAAAFTQLGPARIDAHQELDDEICKWIQTDALATMVANRHVTALGPGLLEWRFTSIYPYPELEPGDLVCIETDQFLARDPNANRGLRGVLWAAGVVRSVDVSATRFIVWIRNYADIFGAEEATRRFSTPDVLDARAIQRGATLVIQTLGGVAVRSMKFATSTSSQPAAGTGTAVDGQSPTFTTSTFAYADSVYITVTPYSEVSGGGNAGPALQFRSKLGLKENQYDATTGRLKRSADLDDGLFVGKATTNDGERWRAKVYRSSSQTISNDTLTVINWNAESYDVGTLHDNSTNNERITIPTGGNTGVWAFVVQIQWAAGGTGIRRVEIIDSSGVVIAHSQWAVGASTSHSHACHAFVNAPSVGEYFRVQVRHTQGADLDVVGTLPENSFFQGIHLV